MTEVGRLQAWMQQQIAGGLPAFAGARVTGTIPVQVSLLNELIAQGLADAASGAGKRPGDGPGLDVATLARMVRHVRVDAGPGVITLDFEAGIG